MATSSFKLLYVCNANNARSPLAAACTRQLLSRSPGKVRWSVASAGTHAVEGIHVRPEARTVAEVLSLDLSDHSARLLTPDLCLEHDLVLAMSWEQVSHIWSLVPEAWDKVFTIKEFVHWAKRAAVRPSILFPDQSEQMRDKVIQSHAVRKRARADHGFWGGIRPQDLNLIEPNGRGDEAWHALGQAVHALVSDIITLLVATGDGAPVTAHARRKPRVRSRR